MEKYGKWHACTGLVLQSKTYMYGHEKVRASHAYFVLVPNYSAHIHTWAVCNPRLECASIGDFDQSSVYTV